MFYDFVLFENCFVLFENTVSLHFYFFTLKIFLVDTQDYIDSHMHY